MEKPKQLPFKRRVVRKSSDGVAEKKTGEGDLFGATNHDMFFDHMDAKSKVVKEKRSTLQEKTRREKNDQRDKEPSNKTSRSATAAKSTPLSGSKRRHLMLSDAEDDDELTSPSRSSRQSPRISSSKKARLLTSPSSKPGRQSTASTQVISLDSDDEEDTFATAKLNGKGKEKAGPLMANGSDAPSSAQNHRVSDDDDELPHNGSLKDPDPSDIGAEYVRLAQERAKLRKAALEAEEARVVPAVEVIIESRLPDIPPLKVKMPINKRLSVMKNAWKDKAMEKLGDLPSVTPTMIDSVFLTWKERKIQDVLTLERLGITPDSKGYLTAQTQEPTEGFANWDKVHLEAWTQELYDQHMQEKERERKRNLGELEDDVSAEETPAKAQAPKKIRITLKSKYFEDFKLNTPMNTTVGRLIQAFRKTQKDSLPAEKVVKIHFDGEILKDHETMDSIGVEDMDSMEVHITNP